MWKLLQDKISKDQNDSKKMPSKTAIYSPQTSIDQKKPIRPKPQPLTLTSETIETKNYDMACFVSSILLEGENNGFLFENITNPAILMPKKEVVPEKPQKIESAEAKTFVPTMKIDTTEIAPTHNTKIQPAKKTFLPFKIRKRIGRCNRVLIDRYLPESEEEANLSQFYVENNKSYMSNKENDVLKEKMSKFASICVFSDSEDETNESFKNLKKNILVNFKNFLKQNRSQMLPIKT